MTCLDDNAVVDDVTAVIKISSNNLNVVPSVSLIKISNVPAVDVPTNLKPIWVRSDLLNELGEGIDEKTKIRINLFYEDNETNPNNYKFMIREYESSEVAGVDNTSMYNK